MVKSKKAAESERRASARKKEPGEDDSYSFDDGGGASESGEDMATTAPDLSMDALRKRQYIINKIDEEYARVMQDPNHPLDKELEQLRKSNYKLNYNRKLKCAAKTGKRGGGASGDPDGAGSGGGGGGSRRKEITAERAAAERGGSERAGGGAGGMSAFWGGLPPAMGPTDFGMGSGLDPPGLHDLQSMPGYRGGPGLTSPTDSGREHAVGLGGLGPGGAAGVADYPPWDTGAGGAEDDDEMLDDGGAAAAAAAALAAAAAGGGGIGSPRKVAQRRLPPHLHGAGGGPGASGGGVHAAPGRRSSLERTALLSAIADGKITKLQGPGRRQSGSGSGSATPRQMQGGPLGSPGALPVGAPLHGLGTASGPDSPRRLPGSAGPQSPRVRRGLGSPAVAAAMGPREASLDGWGQQQLQQQQHQMGGGEDEWTARPQGSGRSHSPAFQPPHATRGPQYGSSSGMHGLGGMGVDGTAGGFGAASGLAGGVDGPGLAGGRGGFESATGMAAGVDPYGSGGFGGGGGRGPGADGMLAAGVNAILADTSASDLLAGLEAAAAAGGGGRQSLGAEQLSTEELALLGIQGPDRELIIDPTTDTSLDPLLDILLLGDAAMGAPSSAAAAARQQAAAGTVGAGSGPGAVGPGMYPPPQYHPHQQQHPSHGMDRLSGPAPGGSGAGGGLSGHYDRHGDQALGPGPYSGQFPAGQARGTTDAMSGVVPGAAGFSDGAGASIVPVGVSSLLRGGGYGGGYGASVSAPYRQHRLSSVTGAGGTRVSRFAGSADHPASGPLPPHGDVGGYGSLGDGGPGSGGLVGFRSYDEGLYGTGGAGGAGSGFPAQRSSASIYGSRFGGAGGAGGLDGTASGGLLDRIGPGVRGGDFGGRRMLQPGYPHHPHVVSAGEGRHSAPGNIGIPGWDDAGAGGGVGCAGGGGGRGGYDLPADTGVASAGLSRRMLQSSTGVLDPVPEQTSMHGAVAGPAAGPDGPGLDGGWRARSLAVSGAAGYLDDRAGAGTMSYSDDVVDVMGRPAALGRRLDRNLGGSWGPSRRQIEGMHSGEAFALERGGGGHMRSASSSGFGQAAGGMSALNGGPPGGGGGAERASSSLTGYGAAGGRGYGGTAVGGPGPSLSSIGQFDRREQLLAREQLLRAMQRRNSNNSGGGAYGAISGGGGVSGVPAAAAAAAAALQGPQGLPRLGSGPELAGGRMLGRMPGGSGAMAGVSQEYPDMHPSPTPETIASLQGLRLRNGEDDPAAAVTGHGDLPHMGYPGAEPRRNPGAAAAASVGVSSTERELTAIMEELQELRRHQHLRSGGAGAVAGAPAYGGGAAAAGAYGGGAAAHPYEYGSGPGAGGGGAARQRFGGGAAGGGGGGGGLLQAVDHQLSDIDTFMERNLELLRRNNSGGGIGSYLAEGGAGAAGGGASGAAGADTQFTRDALRKELRQGSAEQWEAMLRQLGGGMGGGGGGGGY